ncbi:hypothetical protein ACQUWZ_26195, partial [Ralstonia pseudosolanacearum]|uniref:hypothetical protein n=1 Tax=Ralstonia pseudosolanacearum TaxID=1310165 RepID=UPI003D16B74A
QSRSDTQPHRPAALPPRRRLTALTALLPPLTADGTANGCCCRCLSAPAEWRLKANALPPMAANDTADGTADGTANDTSNDTANDTRNALAFSAFCGSSDTTNDTDYGTGNDTGNDTAGGTPFK